MDGVSLQRNTIIGLVASLVLTGVKLAAGIFGHSSALVADAIESLADSVGSIVVWQGIRVASRPVDEDHPYGYGKAEALSALAVGALLLVAAIWVVVKAFQEFFTPHSAPEWWTLLVLVVVIVVKEVLFRVVLKGADAMESDAARADAWHHRSDAITSAAALIGVVVAIWGPQVLGWDKLVLADEAAAMIASGMIFFTAIRLIRPSLAELLDAAAHDLAERVRVEAESVEGVRLIEKLHVRKSGRGYLADMHLHVDPEMSVSVAHALAGKVKATVRQRLPKIHHVLIHVEPAVGAESGSLGEGNVGDGATEQGIGVV